MWAAIDWRGNFSEEQSEGCDRPSTEEFKCYFTELFNKEESVNLESVLNAYETNIPILDDCITVEEVDHEIHNLKTENPVDLMAFAPL